MAAVGGPSQPFGLSGLGFSRSIARASIPEHLRRSFWDVLGRRGRRESLRLGQDFRLDYDCLWPPPAPPRRPVDETERRLLRESVTKSR